MNSFKTNSDSRSEPLRARVGFAKLKSLVFVFAFVMMGSVLYFVSKASGPYGSLEPEQGNKTAGAVTDTDPSASGGQFAQFGGSSAAPAGYALMWQDDFNGTVLDPSKWNYFTGQGGSSDIQYTTDAVTVGGGALGITTYTNNGTHYTGWINTENKYQPKYGYIEASINFTSANNAVGGAFWLFHSLVNSYGDPWNHGVEMDVVEKAKTDYLGNDISDQASANLNWGQYGPEWPNHPSVSSGVRGAGLATGYHTYAVEWTPTAQKYYIDGQYMWQVNDSSVTPVSRRDEYLLLSQHPVGGAVNYGSKASSVSKMTVDYVRVYQLGSSTPPAPTGLTKTGGSGNTTLSWQVAANATGYNIKRSTSNRGYVTIGSTAGLNYTDTTGSVGVDYYYVVTAIDSAGESPNSLAMLVTPNLATAKPVVASSQRQAASSAVDGSSTTFWESDWGVDPQWIYVDLQQATNINGVVLNWELAYAKSYMVEVSLDGTSWTQVYSTAGGDGGVDEVSFASHSARYVRVYGQQRAHPYADPSPFGYALKEFEVYGSMPAPAPTNLSAYKANQSVKLIWTPAVGTASYAVMRATSSGGPYTVVASGLAASSYTDSGLTNAATYYHVVVPTGSYGGSNEVRTTPGANLALWQQTYASSKENTDTQPFKAIDGMTDTFNGITSSWASAFSDPQWYYVDLQTSYAVNRVVLNWDYMYGKAFEVQVSSDAVSWSSVYSTVNGTGGVSDLSFAPVNARYIRMLGHQRGTAYAYSLKEMEVYGQ